MKLKDGGSSVIDLISFAKRRNRFLTELGGAAAIIPSASMVVHHADCEHQFRQNSDIWYLTGLDEPDGVALFLPYRPSGQRFVLFVLPKQKELEVWNGSRIGVEEAVDKFGADIAHPIEEFPERLFDYLKGAESIAFRVGKHPKIEMIVLEALSKSLDGVYRNGSRPLSLIPPCPLLHQSRLIKESWEIERLRCAAQIAADAHEVARTAVRPGMSERQVQAIIEHTFLEKGARGPAYTSIVAGGDNACVLHYIENNDVLREGDLLLIDAGCSLMDYYNSDITRTFPINGKFSSEQKAIYEIVLAAQMAAIDSVVIGKNAEEVHAVALKILVEGLIDLKLLKGKAETIIEEGAYHHLYMHRTGHWLGLDVHDVGAYRLGEFPVKLVKGMVLTVEPGLYISDRLPVPEGQPAIPDRWKGIGIRIEDDVAVSEDGPDVLSCNARKNIESLERNIV